MNKKQMLYVATLSSLFGILPSQAASINTAFSVTANVLNTCSTVTATALGFGDYDPLSGTDKDSTSTIDVTCTNGTPFIVKLNGGTNGTITQRKLKEDAGSDELNYNLYTDASRSTLWGDGSTGQTLNDTGTGSAVQETVYGRISGGQTSKTAGSYSDTINVTVDY